MLNINHMCLLSVSALALSVCASPATAGNIDISTPPSISTHITHTALELKPLISSGYNIAGLTWLPDLKDSEVGPTGNKMENDFNRGDPCKGYTLFSCPTHGTCKPCLVNNNKKQLVSCSSPYLVSGNSCVCPQTVSLTYANDKCTQYCDSKCIKKTCDKTPNQTGCTNGTQSCDDGCGGTARQCCIPCTDKITSKPANSNYTYSTCVDGEGSHQIQTGWACISGYHTKDSGCEKDCNATNCSGYTLSSCPANGNCSKCTITASNCSTDGTKYKLDSCMDGYALSNGQCVEAPKTCADWIKANYSDFTLVTSSSQSLSGKKVAVLTDVNVSYGASVSSGGLLVGPKYFNYEKCQSMSTPKISVSSKTSAAVNLSGGTVSDINVYFDPVSYEIWGKSGICSYYDSCQSNAQYSNFYEYVRSQAGYTSCSSYNHYNPTSDKDILCSALSNVERDCYDSYSGYKSCDNTSYYGCSCSNANQMACYAMYDAADYCANNEHGAIEGYGTVRNVSVTTKSGMSVAHILNNNSGTLTLSGNNSLVASTLSSRRGSSARATNVVIADGTTLLHIGDSFVINGTLTINNGATLNVEYAELGGLSLTSGDTVNVYGKLNIASYGTGGKYNNDIEVNKGTVNAKSTSCIILKNGGGGDGGYVGSVTSGTFKFESGSRLKIGGTCKKATQSGSASIGDQPKPNNLYGNFTSPPAGYNGSCNSCS